MQSADTALIIDLQRFSLHDGPGIRTTVFFKGCPMRCRWCHNPESWSPDPELAFYSNRCQQLAGCVAICPEGAILPDPRHRIDFARCNVCGLCAEACSSRAIEVVGRRWTQEALLEAILADRAFFQDSGGGVTFSGGEPLLHGAFLKHLLPRLKAEGIHTNIETAGLWQWSTFEPLLPYLDLVYFDLKHLDPETHEALTGCGNRRILDNFARLAREFEPLQARMPIIPGLNDDPTNIRATARFLRQHRHHTLHCLPYCDFGDAKIDRLSTTRRPLGLGSRAREALAAAVDRFESEGIHVVVYD